MTSARASVSAARGLRSERLPIGVATIYRPGERRVFMREPVMAEQASHRQAPLRWALALLAALGLAGCALVPAPAVEAPPPALAVPRPEPIRAVPPPPQP